MTYAKAAELAARRMSRHSDNECCVETIVNGEHMLRTVPIVLARSPTVAAAKSKVHKI